LPSRIRLAGDPVHTGAAQIVQVRLAGETGVDRGDDPPEPPAAQVVLDLGPDRDVGGVAGQTCPSRVTTNPMTS
jgi:hypothetical protein